MSQFVQIHALMTYPPGNPNRDDLGRPKTVVIGGTPRQRISSQCLKRTWRRSEAFAEFAKGVRTKDVVGSVQAQLEQGRVPTEKAQALARRIGEAVGSQSVKPKSEKGKTKSREKGEEEMEDNTNASSDGGEKGAVLTFLTLHEVGAIKKLVERLSKKADANIDDDLAALPSVDEKGNLREVGPDVALFGRMVAKKPTLGIDAALQVAHAFTVHKSGVEVDYWTGVSDEDPWFDAAKSISEAGSGASMIETTSFGGGVFYLYACVNRTQLEGNLSGDTETARAAIRALVKALVTTTPSGMKTAFATNGRAEFLLVEEGTAQPRSLAAAFQTPMEQATTAAEAAKRLLAHKKALDTSYADSWKEASFLAGGGGTLGDVLGTI